MIHKKNIIELEILRAHLFKIFLNRIIQIFKNEFDIENHIKFKNKIYIEVNDIIVRWIFILISDNDNDISEDAIFKTKISQSLKIQVYTDIDNFFKNNNPKNRNLEKISDFIIYIIELSFSEYSSIIKEHINNNLLKNDNKVTINNNVLTYYSKNISSNMQDKGLVIDKNKISFTFFGADLKYINQKDYDINLVFANYFRYLYFGIRNQSLAFRYDGNRNEAVECFSTPYNRYYNHFCSAFPDQEMSLGSLGNFFDVTQNVILGKMKFPVNNLKINPIFDEIVTKKMANLIIKLLSTKTKYTISSILPNWVKYEAKDILLNSKYYKKKEEFDKYHLHFNNYFNGKKICPCNIIIIYLSN
tara:strand:- start:65 stop:1141 length:1077 start_codon:yes stop_codon:yes gene_type:complete